VILRALSPNGGETVKQLRAPLKDDERQNGLNQLVDDGLVKIKLNKGLLPCVFRANGEGVVTQPPVGPITEEAFRAAFQELERGKSYVRICDMRRRLNWTEQEFDTKLKKLRDEGKIQLQVGDIDFFNEQDLRESFVDENGFRMLKIVWRH
jgi:hypothetical protein